MIVLRKGIHAHMQGSEYMRPPTASSSIHEDEMHGTEQAFSSVVPSDEAGRR
ncbi:hypothetical protein [Streptomyces sp. UH6]|uniref:hypothetical protein n=1 Tax=Streptomyces sp. UH6 TaxID=2748379 RepID=UPI0015D4F98C|nr:hypothetical protein [Streptomyces sp. UH6]NYV78417.1 hypothetical protein [Streptomyces sp. UH6]